MIGTYLKMFNICLGVLEVVPPEWPDLVLAADIPHGEADVLVFHRLDIKACF